MQTHTLNGYLSKAISKKLKDQMTIDDEAEIDGLHKAMKTDSGCTVIRDLQKQAMDKIRIVTTSTEQCTEAETLHEINSQLNHIIGLIKCLSQDTAPVLPP